MAYNQYNTMEDLQFARYPFLRDNEFFAKTDAPHLTTTTGLENDVYGATLWVQQNLEDNAFGVQPKLPWNFDGWRVTTATAVSESVAENATIPDTVKSTFLEVATNPKVHQIHFDNSEILELKRQKTMNDNFGSMDDIRVHYGQVLSNGMNAALMQDVDTLAGTDFESIDRVCSNNSEVSDATISLDAGDSDIYGIDRDGGAGWSDAYVDHNSGTDRSLSDSIIRTLRLNVRANGGHPRFWLTGHDTKSATDGLYQDAVRYNDGFNGQRVAGSINGIETDLGANFGVPVASVYGLPMIVTNDTAVDTTSRLYALDTTVPTGKVEPRLHMAMLQPTQYAEYGTNIGEKNPLPLNRFGNDGVFWTIGELRCKFFAAQGKVRDLQ